MLTLTYHPINDPYHCAFRALRLLFYSDKQPIFKEGTFSILDYYMLFPSLVSKIQMTRQLRTAFSRLKLNAIPEPYQKLPDARRLFRQLENVQREAYRNLAAAEILDVVNYRGGSINLGPKNVSQVLAEEIKQANESNTAQMLFLADHLGEMPLYGPDGLKARTGLMEYRYDAPQA